MHPHRVVEAQKLLTRWVAAQQLAERFPLYGGYLRSLASAERLNAVHQYLRPLILELTTKSHERCLELVYALCQAVDWLGRVPGTLPVPGIPHELLEQIVLPTLLAQRTDRPDDAYAHLWLAMLPSRTRIADLPASRELLERAHQLAPSDAFIAERIADERLNSIWFSCHHLPETLLNSEDAIREEIKYLRRLIPLVRQEKRLTLTAEADRYEQEINKFVHTNR